MEIKYKDDNKVKFKYLKQHYSNYLNPYKS